MSVKILYVDYGERAGWDPVTYMVHLAAHAFETQPLIADQRTCVPGAWARLLGLLPRSRFASAEDCLVIAPNPPALWALTRVEGWRRRFHRVFAWVIDSFWLEWLPALVRWSSPFDAFFVTNLEDVEEWTRRTRRPCHWLPWGTDALGLGSASPERPTDLLRVGRQPQAWDDDDENARACGAVGLNYTGRPPVHDAWAVNQQALMTSWYGKARFVLAFSNRVSPAGYTHPSREYLTARWADSLACGASVAGLAPRTQTARELLWPEGLLELDPLDPRKSLGVLSEAVRRWDPSIPRRNHQYALERFDWRWRFDVIARHLGGSFPVLSTELARLQSAVSLGASALEKTLASRRRQLSQGT